MIAVWESSFSLGKLQCRHFWAYFTAICVGISVAFWTVSSPARAEEGIAHHLTCTFDKGTTTTYESGEFESKPSRSLTFEIANIDLAAQSARLLTGDGDGAGTLRIVRALNANHFLEVVNEGFLNLTTIYDLDTARGSYPAVHSRHLGLLGQPVFAQYSGHCKAVP
ncbi:MAG: hypothetical protein ACK5KM_12150 [Hyphomicrobiaceae bacterium]